MRTGKLRHSITIQQLSHTPDSYNDVQQTWQTLGATRAEITPISGRQYFEMHAQNIAVDHKVTLRYRSGIDPKMRVLWGSKVLEIVDVIDLNGLHKELQLMCVDRGQTA